jgi:hypothetical protein
VVALLLAAVPLLLAPVAGARSHAPAHSQKPLRCKAKSKTRTTSKAKAKAKRMRCAEAAKAKKRRAARKPSRRTPGPSSSVTPGRASAPSAPSAPSGGSTPSPVPAPGQTSTPVTAPAAAPATPAAGARWIPPKNLTWYWQLAGTVDRSKTVAAYDIDGHDNSASDVAALHAQGKKVICYISAGTYEPGRPDSAALAAYSGRGVSGWPAERWLDIRQQGVRDIMAARIRMCADKGFDGLEPDNVDGYSNPSGFPLAAADQLSYNRFLAATAHAAGLAVFLKNDAEQAAELEPSFDGVVTEECNQYDECDAFAPYLRNGKPVLNAEYTAGTSFCSADNAAGIMGARYDLDLAGRTFQPCW